MSHIRIKRDHSMSQEDLRKEVQALAEQLVDKFGGSYHWDGDEVHYDYSGGVNACVSCSQDAVELDIKLGMMMSMFKGKIKNEVEGYLDKHIS
ncbi:MAG: hypothetical protein CMK32_13910 [Porticoccaceae bacterium]|nr:hypothetical protein [Porticoccaceae bacterium]